MATTTTTDPDVAGGANVDFNVKADSAIANRDVPALTQLAKDSIGTPQSGVLVELAKKIQTSSDEFNKLVDPINKAGGAATPQGRQQIATTFETVADNPQWGTALLKFVLGDKAGAVKQITGGDITKSITYDKNGDQILETKNQLGEPISYFHRGMGRNLTAQEYNDLKGGVSAFADTLKGKLEFETRGEANKVWLKDQEQGNRWFQISQAHKPIYANSYETLKTAKTDIPTDLYNKIIGSVTQNNSQASTKSNSTSTLNQLGDDLSRGESVTVNNKISAATGIPIGVVLRGSADNAVSNDNKYNISINKLKQKQTTENIGSEAAQSSSATIQSINEAERLKQLDPVMAQKLRKVIEDSNQIGRETMEFVDKYGKPAFISLPTSASFVDKQAQMMAQSLQGLHNATQMENYIKYLRYAKDGYDKTNTVPMPGEVGTNFTMQPISKDTRRVFSEEINKVMGGEFQASQRKPDQPKTDQQPVSQEDKPKEAVAPPKKAIPKGVPAGSVAVGWSKSGQRVYKAPDNSLHTGD
jgi:hypothetical protein